jgi:alpha-glucosidase
LATPQTPEIYIAPGGEKGALLANSSDDLISPWRILAIGDLPRIMESTLGTDVAEPAIAMQDDFIKPGHSSWSWVILKDDFTTFDVQKKFIDYAADMHWDYTLIDADWDKKIGYEKLKELVDYAAQKNIGILVWFNSSGDWNETPYSPKSELLTREQRNAVFARLKEIGVKGLKIDFFSGDGQSMIAYYTEIMADAASHSLSLNFHGATLPRGWQRTYPHLMTVEAIKGFEFTTFTQADQDPVAAHVAMSLFARNVFDPMDYTPMVFGDIPNIKRVTENSFELAESVLMISGIQHFAEIPEGMATAPDYVKTFLQELPREWDDVKFIDGFPGKYAVIARRAGDAWYIAGINAETENKTLSLDLGFVGDKKGILITSGEGARDFSQQDVDSKIPHTITLRPSAGFVMMLK